MKGLFWVPALIGFWASAALGETGIPRTADGKPNLSGIWQVLNTADWNIEDHQALPDAPAGQGVVEGGAIPYQEWAAKKKHENFARRATADPLARCDLPGVPRVTYTPLPFEIFQAEKQVSFFYQYAHAVRFAYMNGAKHPEGPIDWWLGDSRGHWEADTLVVDVVHFNDQTWFDRSGNFHSDALHVVERYTLSDADHIRYEVTLEDPKVFTRPWKMNMVLYRHTEPNFQLLEHECYGFDYEKYYP